MAVNREKALGAWAEHRAQPDTSSVSTQGQSPSTAASSVHSQGPALSSALLPTPGTQCACKSCPVKSHKYSSRPLALASWAWREGMSHFFFLKLTLFTVSFGGNSGVGLGQSKAEPAL